ncbi:GDSL-type esterase/lipase family protein [Sphingomonas sp. A2-49]|uniref:SGNH/GDSL hydrolase family protein n=1 Tax=Sphingomonas sp. A2-49 TaxID=1391375 RepID=UPI0021CE2FEE|nr:SGNH/GDSL hydrolase family protein [Sphingomonas sp. A2-49]MCU6455942.1 GDSL-type esterase/lipase family protein [Sphingomonas sp. A2-49]
MIAALLLAAASVTPVPAGTATGPALPVRVVGRALRVAAGWRRQWPGTYFEGAFRGRQALLRVGEGDVILHVTVDGTRVGTLVKPAPGLYRIAGLSAARHVLRVAVASESQGAPTVFGGMFAATGTVPLPPPAAPTRQIEFIGDSHTVGYGNTAGTRECSQDRVWATTDTVRGIAGQVARRYGADYRVHAISGRGVVRNYDGFAADTTPEAYPHALFDRATPADDAGWNPQLIVVALGTNDFSTALKPGERWADRDALHADYEARYMAFVRSLRTAHPRAHVLLWATDLADGEIAAEEAKVAARLTVAGLRDVGFVQVPKLAFTGCHFHPSVADDTLIAGAIGRYVAAHPRLWAR